MISEYVYKNHKKLRRGYTTGTCAAAAACAAARMLLTGRRVDEIEIDTPSAISLKLKVFDVSIGDGFAKCAIKKDAGDDADCTDGMLIYACARRAKSGINVDGGEGVGRVTKAGLGLPIGAAAINETPMRMIEYAARKELEDAGADGGLDIVISAPEGRTVAKKTFNPRLGIEGGISILGTTGIVEPMSEEALLDVIRIELNQKKAQNADPLFISPGNYGKSFAMKEWGLDMEKCVKCGNFIGDTLDMALELGFCEILFVGHIGKLSKIAVGVMNTHSSVADARLESILACAVLGGCKIEEARRLLGCATTDEALEILKKCGRMEAAMKIMLDRMIAHMARRVENKIDIRAVIFSNREGVLAKSDGTDEFIDSVRKREA